MGIVFGVLILNQYSLAQSSNNSSKQINKMDTSLNKGIKTILYPVKDITVAKALFTKFLGVEPYADYPYWVGFKIGDQEIGLVPDNAEKGVAAYFRVTDIKKSLHMLTDAGAIIIKDITDVGGGRLIASVKDANGNIIGLVQQN